LFGKPDVTVIVVESTKLERNLNLVLQLLEITDRAVLCLNLIDEAERNEINIDERTLSKELGIPVVPTSARSKIGMSTLIEYINKVATGEYQCRPHKLKGFSKKIKYSVSTLAHKVRQTFPELPNLNWVAIKLLEGDQTIIDAVKNGEIGQLSQNQPTNMSEVI
jgi:ferrous iron transport protein B